jgi:hypothetical protein
MLSWQQHCRCVYRDMHHPARGMSCGRGWVRGMEVVPRWGGVSHMMPLPALTLDQRCSFM